MLHLHVLFISKHIQGPTLGSELKNDSPASREEPPGKLCMALHALHPGVLHRSRAGAATPWLHATGVSALAMQTAQPRYGSRLC